MTDTQALFSSYRSFSSCRFTLPYSVSCLLQNFFPLRNRPASSASPMAPMVPPAAQTMIPITNPVCWANLIKSSIHFSQNLFQAQPASSVKQAAKTAALLLLYCHCPLSVPLIQIPPQGSASDAQPFGRQRLVSAAPGQNHLYDLMGHFA